MHSPRFKDIATQAWLLQGCSCILGGSDPGQPVSKTRSTKSSACRHDFVSKTATSLFPNTTFINHESIPSPQEAFAQFIKAFPSYSNTLPIDEIRAREFPHLSFAHHVCLDYVGVGLFSSEFPLFSLTFRPVSLKSQLNHGGQGPELESSIRKRIMDFLNISENDYTMVFTANKSAAFRLVAESYPFQSSRKLLTVYDHQSEAADAMLLSSQTRGARVMAAEFKWPRLRIHSPTLRKMIIRKKKKQKQRGLFVFPLQSRTSGAVYSYQWMNLAHEHGWHVLLDASALGPKHMDTFGLSLFRPDFLITAFYKVFGQNPTGFGCLFVKKSVVPILESSGTGAGIVSITPPKDDSVSAVVSSNVECRCLDQMDSLGLRLINSRGRYLINWLVTALMKLQHPNRLESFPMVIIYGPQVKFERGPALAFNIQDWKGEIVEPALVQKLADRNHISLGQGFLQHIRFSDDSIRKSGRKIAVVTAALTFLANFEDVYRLWAFVALFLDADFVEKERWRYTALNQNIVEVL